MPRVTSLYTLLNLTGMDVTLGGRATVESELESKRKVGHHALHWITLILFTERERGILQCFSLLCHTLVFSGV